MVQAKLKDSTIDDLMALPEHTKAELINGAIYNMAPASSEHSIVNGELTAAIKQFHGGHKDSGGDDKGNKGWLIIPEAWIFYDTHNSFVHDIAGYRRGTLEPRPKSGPIVQRPDWVCEIISPSNWSNDTQYKRVILEEHKVPYYWLVDPIQKTIQILEMTPQSEHYQFTCAVDIRAGIVQLPPFHGLKLNLEDIFKDV